VNLHDFLNSILYLRIIQRGFSVAQTNSSSNSDLQMILIENQKLIRKLNGFPQMETSTETKSFRFFFHLFFARSILKSFKF